MQTDIQKAAELSYISKYAGQSEEFTQASSGNASVKLDENRMMIKASGLSLSEVETDSGFAEVDLGKLRRASQSADVSDERAILREARISGGEPSIETFLHTAAKAYTIHVHALAANILSCSENGRETLGRMFPEAAIIPYAVPGLRLFREFTRKTNGKCPDVIFLENHGLIVSADSAEEAAELLRSVTLAVMKQINRDPEPLEDNLKLFRALNRADSRLIAYRINSPRAAEAVKRAGGAWEHRFTLESVVCCGKKFFETSEINNVENELEAFRAENGLPKVIIANGRVYAAAQNVRRARELESVLELCAEIYLAGGTRVLSDEDAEFLSHWK